MQSPLAKRRCKRSSDSCDAMLPTEETNGDALVITSNGNGTSNGLSPLKKLKQTDKDIIRIIGQHLIDLGLKLEII